jgi:hypothetical protein
MENKGKHDASPLLKYTQKLRARSGAGVELPRQVRTLIWRSWRGVLQVSSLRILQFATSLLIKKATQAHQFDDLQGRGDSDC